MAAENARADERAIIIRNLPLKIGSPQTKAQLKAAGLSRYQAQDAINGMVREGVIALQWLPDGLYFARRDQ